MDFAYIKKEYTTNEKRGLLWTTASVFIFALAVACIFEKNIDYLRIIAIVGSSGLAGYCFSKGMAYFEAKL
jgi:hypothetical protein